MAQACRNVSLRKRHVRGLVVYYPRAGNDTLRELRGAEHWHQNKVALHRTAARLDIAFFLSGTC